MEFGQFGSGPTSLLKGFTKWDFNLQVEESFFFPTIDRDLKYEHIQLRSKQHVCQVTQFRTCDAKNSEINGVLNDAGSKNIAENSILGMFDDIWILRGCIQESNHIHP